MYFILFIAVRSSKVLKGMVRSNILIQEEDNQASSSKHLINRFIIHIYILELYVYIRIYFSLDLESSLLKLEK